MQERASSPAFEQLSGTNRGPLIIITTFIFLIASCLAVTVKTWTRLAISRSVALTDWSMLSCLVFAIGQAIALTISVNHGLGKHSDALTSAEIETASQAFYTSNILAIAVLGCAKASVTLLIISIQPLRPVLVGCYSLLGVVGAWMVAGMLALAFQCDVPKPWVLGPETCVDQYAMQIGLGAVNIATDVMIVVMAYLMMRTTQVASSRKWAVVAMFGVRFATPPFAICALVASSTYYTDHDRTWHAVMPSIWTQIMLHVSIITACIPSIKRFLADVQSGLMGATISEQYEMEHSGGKTIQLQSGMGTGLGSKIASRLGVVSHSSVGRSRNKESPGDSTQEETYGHHAFARQSRARSQTEENESVKGLARNVIHQKIDYEIEFEHRGDDRSSSDGQEKFP